MIVSTEDITFQTRHGVVGGKVSGQGAPLLLLHGNPGDSGDYGAVIPGLAKDYRVIALDWPGYGVTPAPAPPEKASIHFFKELLFDVLDSFSEPVTLVGNSVGGYVAVRAAVERPAKVQALVLVNPAGFTPIDGLTQWMCKVRGSSFGARFLAEPLARMQLFSKTETTGAMVSRLAERSKETCEVDAAVWRSFVTAEQDVKGLQAHIKAPTLLVWGKWDPTLSFERDGRRAVRALPKAQLQVMDAGHAPFAEKPEDFLSLLRPFLAQSAAPQH